MLLTLLPSVLVPMFLAVVDQTIVSTALPSIIAELGNAERASWVVVAYLIANTIAAPVYGNLRDSFGTRRLMVIALIIFMLASLLCALATSVEALIVTRLLQGFGGGGLMTLAQTRIGEAIAPSDRPRYQGYLAFVIVTSSALGPVLGGFLSHAFGWRSIFLINLPLGVVAVWQVLKMSTPAPAAKARPFDYVGLVLFASFIAPLLIAFGQGAAPYSARASLVVVLLASSAAAGWLLVRRERRIEHPLFPFDLLAKPSIARADALAACHGAGMVATTTVMPLYLHIFNTSSASTVGLLLLPLLIGVGLGSMTTARLVMWSGRTAIFPTIGLGIGAGLMLLLAALAGRIGATGSAVVIGCIGLCMGTVMGVVQITVQSTAGRARLGAAAASVQLSRSLGAALGTAAVGMVLFLVLAVQDRSVASDMARLVASGLAAVPADRQAALQGTVATAFAAVFATIALVMAAGSAVAASIPARRLARNDDAEAAGPAVG